MREIIIDVNNKTNQEISDIERSLEKKFIEIGLDSCFCDRSEQEFDLLPPIFVNYKTLKV